MKRKCLLGLLGLTATLGIVGSGFSAWYFDATDLTAEKSVNTYVTNLADGIGTLTDDNASDTMCIVLDQGEYKNKDDVTKGISLKKYTGTVSDSTLGEEVSSLSATYTIDKTTYTDLNNAGIHSGTFTATFSLSETADDYIVFNTSYLVGNIKIDETAARAGLTVNATTLTFTSTVDWSSENADTLTKKFTFDVSTSEYTNKLLNYVTSKKPTDKSSYEAMKTALNDKTALTVKYSFKANTTNA